MSAEYPSLEAIAADYNNLSAYIDYVHRCVDERKLPMKFGEWEDAKDEFMELLFETIY